MNLKRFHKLNEMCLIKVIRSRMVPMLYKLNLGGFTLSPRIFHVLVENCPKLRVLCLESTTFVEDFTGKVSSKGYKDKKRKKNEKEKKTVPIFPLQRVVE